MTDYQEKPKIENLGLGDGKAGEVKRPYRTERGSAGC